MCSSTFAPSNQEIDLGALKRMANQMGFHSSPAANSTYVRCHPLCKEYGIWKAFRGQGAIFQDILSNLRAGAQFLLVSS